MNLALLLSDSHLSHFTQTRYRRRPRLMGVNGSTGVWKAVRTPEIPLQTPSLARETTLYPGLSPSRGGIPPAPATLPRVRLPVRNLTLTFRPLPVLYTRIYISRLHTKISRYTVLTYPCNVHKSLSVVDKQTK